MYRPRLPAGMRASIANLPELQAMRRQGAWLRTVGEHVEIVMISNRDIGALPQFDRWV
jgi:hypothetical protein